MGTAYAEPVGLFRHEDPQSGRIEIQSGEDEALLLALTVAIDDMSRD